MSSAHIEARRQLVPLSCWLKAAQAAGIQVVPALWGPYFSLDEWYAGIDGQPAMPGSALDQAIAWADMQRAEADRLEQRILMRWECSSSMQTKHMLATGKTYGADPASFRHLWLDDPRAIDCNVIDPTRWCVRPWIEPLRIDGYPLEVRVFYGPHGYRGTSNYYPQRPLYRLPGRPSAARPDPVRTILNESTTMAERLFQVVSHEHPSYHGFTADFMMAKDGTVWFLEGGPPHVMDGPVSAHPCCFKPGYVIGIALTSRRGALTH